MLGKGLGPSILAKVRAFGGTQGSGFRVYEGFGSRKM